MKRAQCDNGMASGGARAEAGGRCGGDASWVVGLDVGGTKIAGGLVEPWSGRALAKQVVPTRPERGGQAVLDTATALAEELMQRGIQCSRNVQGIGVAVAEVVDLVGNVTSESTVRWQGLPIRQHLSRLAPATVESDVRAAALAEARLGAGRRFRTFLYVTVGTGVSACLVQDARPYAGARGGALLVSGNHLSMESEDACQRPLPLLEEYVAGPALVTRYNHGLQDPPAKCAEDVVAAAANGDPTAVEIVRTASEALGAGVAAAVNLLDPEAVVVGGGLGLAGGAYWSSFVASTREQMWADASRNIPILPAALGADAGVVGAALYWADRHPDE